VIDFEPRELTFERREALRRLSRQTMVHLELRRQLLVRNEVVRELERARDRAVAEKAESEQLLLNILPPSIAAELKATGRVQPRFFDAATVILIDFAGFTRLVETMEPASVINQLDQHFTKFDDIMANHRLENLRRSEMPISPLAAYQNPIARTQSSLRGLKQFEDHRECRLVGQAALRSDGAVAHGGEGAFDGVGRPQVFPVLGREVVERQ
jgi:class 3 adenylate cyclase